MPRTVLAAAFALALAVGLAGPAAADPVNSARAIRFDITCGGETFEVVITGGVAAQVVDGTGNVILRAISLTDPTGAINAYSIGQGEQTGLQEDLETCQGFFIIPETGTKYQFEAQVTRTPRGQ